MALAVNFFKIFSRQNEPQQRPEAASHISAVKHLKTNERSDLPQSTLSEKRVVHHFNSFSAGLSNFVLRILIERTLFQNTQISYDTLIFLINDLIKVLSPEKEDTINFAKECTILWKEWRGRPLTDEEKKYDEAPKNLDVTGEILRGLSYSFTGLLGQSVCTSLASAVGQGLWKHAPSIVGYFGLLMWGPNGIASAVNYVLQKSTLSSTQRAQLEPWLITIGRLALSFVPKVHATEKGVHYHYPSAQGSFQTFSPGQTVTVQGDRLSIERQGSFVTPEGFFEATASADFKLQQVMELNEARIKIRVMNNKGQSVPVEFIRVQGKYGPEVQVKCDDKTFEHYWNRYFHPVAKIAPPSDATISCATSLTLGGLGSLVTSSPVLLAAGSLPCLMSAQAKTIKTPDHSCQGMECSVEQKNNECSEMVCRDQSTHDVAILQQQPNPLCPPNSSDVSELVWQAVHQYFLGGEIPEQLDSAKLLQAVKHYDKLNHQIIVNREEVYLNRSLALRALALKDPKISTCQAFTMSSDLDICTNDKTTPSDEESWFPSVGDWHKEVVSELIKDSRDLSKNLPEVNGTRIYLMRGNTASGKSTVIKNFLKIEKVDGVINPDTIKFRIKKLWLERFKLNLTSAQVHRESALLADKKWLHGLVGLCVACSIVVDKRLADLKDIEEMLDIASKRGSDVSLIDIEAPLKTSCQRRFMRYPDGDAPMVEFEKIADGYRRIHQHRQNLINFIKNPPSESNYQLITEYELYYSRGDTSELVACKNVSGEIEVQVKWKYRKAINPETEGKIAEVGNKTVGPIFIRNLLTPHLMKKLSSEEEETINDIFNRNFIKDVCKNINNLEGLKEKIISSIQNESLKEKLKEILNNSLLEKILELIKYKGIQVKDALTPK